MARSENGYKDAEEAYWGYATSIGVQHDRLRALTERLEGDFRADDYGYAVFQDLASRQRAVVSDQILGGAQASISNLVEARIHEQDANSMLFEGERFAEEPTLDLQETSARRDLAFVGFFRGIGSTLDCLAATAIGILRLPYSIRRASFSRLNFPEEIANEKPAWGEIVALVHEHGDNPPGWLLWALEMRHALMHRPRLMNVLLPRKLREPRLWLPEPAVQRIMRGRMRFDPHFRKRPWLPDMQHLDDLRYSASLSDAILSEVATQTLRGCFEASNRLAEALAEFLLAKWDDPDVAGIDPPMKQWAIERPVETEFNGFAPASLPSELALGVINPRDEERMFLATKLRELE